MNNSTQWVMLIEVPNLFVILFVNAFVESLWEKSKRVPSFFSIQWELGIGWIFKGIKYFYWSPKCSFYHAYIFREFKNSSEDRNGIHIFIALESQYKYIYICATLTRRFMNKTWFLGCFDSGHIYVRTIFLPFSSINDS